MKTIPKTIFFWLNNEFPFNALLIKRRECIGRKFMLRNIITKKKSFIEQGSNTCNSPFKMTA